MGNLTSLGGRIERALTIKSGVETDNRPSTKQSSQINQNNAPYAGKRKLGDLYQKQPQKHPIGCKQQLTESNNNAVKKC